MVTGLSGQLPGIGVLEKLPVSSRWSEDERGSMGRRWMSDAGQPTVNRLDRADRSNLHIDSLILDREGLTRCVKYSQ